MIDDLKQLLNPKQFEAATCLEGPLLIIAGAGSGKTTVITNRIAFMLYSGIPQNHILALTFTNKAAREMSERVKKKTGAKLSNLTVSTFHSFGLSLIKSHYDLLGYRKKFSIYDQNDKISLIKQIGEELKIALDGAEIRQAAFLFSSVKTKRIPFKDLKAEWQKIYKEYQENLKLYNAVDFDDLIVQPIELFKKHPAILARYQKKFQYCMVDEFQDTSLVQYELIHLLMQKSKNICVVGDDDQSIYSWRGANYQNIVRFEEDFPMLREVKLEQNYRSTGSILQAANSVIINNSQRKEKALWTGSEQGSVLEIFYPQNEIEEGEFIADTINSRRLRDDIAYQDIGVLVRTNSLCRAIEFAFMQNQIPYRVSGGSSFFERKEIKDILAYLRLICNPDDDVNLLRILNTPRRGIGKTLLQKIINISEIKQISLYSAISSLIFASDAGISKKMREALEDFFGLIEDFRQRFDSAKELAPLGRELVDVLNYWGFLLSEHKDNEKVAKFKYQNIDTLFSFLEQWEKDPDNLNKELYSWLNRITLSSRDNADEKEDNRVNLMTMHAAKGLEFKVVFLAGIEDKIIPHARSVEEDQHNLEEERRLFYVALTRAREKLYITSCRSRKTNRQHTESSPSPFLQEIPEELLKPHIQEEAVTQEEGAAIFAQMKAKFKQES